VGTRAACGPARLCCFDNLPRVNPPAQGTSGLLWEPRFRLKGGLEETGCSPACCWAACVTLGRRWLSCLRRGGVCLGLRLELGCSWCSQHPRKGRVGWPRGEEPLCLSLSSKVWTSMKSLRPEGDQSAFPLITGQHPPRDSPCPPSSSCVL